MVWGRGAIIKIELKKSVALVVFAAVLLDKGTELFCGYLAAVVHELAHLAMSLHLGFRAEGITLGVGGVNLKLKSTSGIKKCIMVLAAGPMMSFFMFGVLFCLRKINVLSMPLIEFASLCIGIANLIPAMPLDGGAMLRAILISRRGIINGAKIMKKISGFFYALLGLVCVIMHGAGLLNFFLVMFEVFLIYSSFSQRRQELAEKKQVFSGETMLSTKIRYITVESECPLLDVASHISSSYFLVAAVFERGRFVGEVTQKQIVESIKNKGAYCMVKDIIK